jgi:hypothetical protein
MSKPPTIDGKLEPGESDRAPAATAFVTAFAGDLCKIQYQFLRPSQPPCGEVLDLGPCALDSADSKSRRQETSGSAGR